MPKSIAPVFLPLKFQLFPPIRLEETLAPMSTLDAHPNRLANLRRSQRVCLSVPVVVTKTEAGRPPLSEEACTQVVSAHGALLILRMAVKFGDKLIILHKKTLEELACRVVNFGAEQAGKKEVGVEFEKPAPRFWRIAFPPADWSPRGPDSKPPTPQPPGGMVAPRKPLPAPGDASKPAAAKAPGPAQS